MIDVIIPCYNAHDTILRTLNSIIYQTIKDKLKVYIVDDASEKTYDYLIDMYSKYIDIKIIRLKKNMGAGLAREEAIKKTKSKYLVFLDSDDYLYTYDSLEILYTQIEKGYDYVASREYDEKGNKILYLSGNLHAKIYRRSYIKKMNIHFNETRYHEDNYFNSLARLCTNNYIVINDKCTYVYAYNKKSVTNIEDKEFERTEIYLKNMKEISNNKNNKYMNEMLYLYKLEKYNYMTTLLKRYDMKKKKQLYEWYHKYDENYFNYRMKKGNELGLLLYKLEFNNKINLKKILEHIVNIDENDS